MDNASKAMLPYWDEDGHLDAPDAIASEYAEAILGAPAGYWGMAERLEPGSSAALIAWAQNHVERRDYPGFFAALEKIRQAVELHGRDAVHGNPEYTDLFVDMMLNAPPRYKAEADAILEPALPKATHVDDKGQRVYSVQQIAEKFGRPVEEVEALVAKHVDPANLHRGPVHAIQ